MSARHSLDGHLQEDMDPRLARQHVELVAAFAHLPARQDILHQPAVHNGPAKHILAEVFELEPDRPIPHIAALVAVRNRPLELVAEGQGQLRCERDALAV